MSRRSGLTLCGYSISCCLHTVNHRVLLRPFKIAEHTSRFIKQHLGWTHTRQRDPKAADRWTPLIIIAYTQLRLARPLAADRGRPGKSHSLPTC